MGTSGEPSPTNQPSPGRLVQWAMVATAVGTLMAGVGSVLAVLLVR